VCLVEVHPNTTPVASGEPRHKASGKDAARPKLDEMLAFVRDGDTVIVHSMDRLAATSTMCAASCGP
jgi:DNA invertase Pin-like site-specific DNA recombinase